MKTVLDALVALRRALSEVYVITEPVEVRLPRMVYVGLCDELHRGLANGPDGPRALRHEADDGITVRTPCGPVIVFPAAREMGK